LLIDTGPAASPHMSPTPTYNRLQQVFSLNWLSNAAIGKTGTQQQLQEYVAEVVQQTLADPETIGLIGQWNLVWGPVVFQYQSTAEHPKLSSDVADNIMFVAQRTVGGSTSYVVAIAGTNPTSWYGWFFEDFDVYKSVAWTDVLAGQFSGQHSSDNATPRISQGTANGVQALLGMTDSANGTLVAFLTKTATAAASEFEVCVSGHSLGGALSATLALYLADKRSGAGGWDPNGHAIVTAMPTAGATPGNTAFATYYDERLGTRTNRIWNALDIVPHAWELDMLNAAPHLYYPYLVPNKFVLGLVALALAQSTTSGQTYLQLNHQTPALAGQVGLAETALSLNPAEIGLDILAGFIASKLAKQFGWSPAVTQAVAKLIEAILEAHAAKAAQPTATSGGLVPDFHPLAILHAAVAKVKADLSDLVAEIGDSEIVESLTGLLRFLAQAGDQHVTAYVILMEITGFAQRMKAVQDSTSSPGNG
jgi:hypothetical protein